MANLNKFRRDTNRAASGRWVPYQEDIELLIASTAQREWKNDIRAAVKSERKPGQVESDIRLDDEFLTKHGRLIARHLLKGWRKIQAEDGAEIPYSVEKATEYLTDPELTDLRLFVLARAGEDEAYQVGSAKSAAGN